MRDATFTELRNHAKDYFDAVEGGDTVRVFRNGKPIAEIVPIRAGGASWKKKAAPRPMQSNGIAPGIPPAPPVAGVMYCKYPPNPPIPTCHLGGYAIGGPGAPCLIPQS